MAEEEYPVVFNSINVEGIQINSGIFVGDNYQPLWSSHSKNNSCIMNTSGNNYIHKPLNLIYDNDEIDYTMFNQNNEKS